MLASTLLQHTDALQEARAADQSQARDVID